MSCEIVLNDFKVFGYENLVVEGIGMNRDTVEIVEFKKKYEVSQRKKENGVLKKYFLLEKLKIERITKATQCYSMNEIYVYH